MLTGVRIVHCPKGWIPAIPANAVGMSNLPGLRLSEGVRPTTGEAVPAGSAPDGLFGYLFP